MYWEIIGFVRQRYQPRAVTRCCIAHVRFDTSSGECGQFDLHRTVTSAYRSQVVPEANIIICSAQAVCQRQGRLCVEWPLRLSATVLRDFS